MNSVAPTPDEFPENCPVCGQLVGLRPSSPTSDSLCPHCGWPLWPGVAADPVRRLAELGAKVEVDAADQITSVAFFGDIYDDTAIERLAELRDVPKIDLRNTAVSESGAERLRLLLPDCKVLF